MFCNFLCLVFFPLGLRCAPVPRVQHLSAGVVDATNQAANHTLQLLQQEQSAKLDAYEAAALSEMEGVAAEKINTQGWVGFESSASFMPMKVAHPAPGVAGLHVCAHVCVMYHEAFMYSQTSIYIYIYIQMYVCMMYMRSIYTHMHAYTHLRCVCLYGSLGAISEGGVSTS